MVSAKLHLLGEEEKNSTDGSCVRNMVKCNSKQKMSHNNSGTNNILFNNRSKYGNELNSSRVVAALLLFVVCNRLKSASRTVDWI